MGTYNPYALGAKQPDWSVQDMGETFARLAQLRAADQRYGANELAIEEQQRGLARTEAWRALIASALEPPSTDAPSMAPPPQPQGLAGQAPPMAPPQGLGMAGQVPPPAPGQPPYGMAQAGPTQTPPQGLAFSAAPPPMQPPGLGEGPPPPPQGLTAPQTPQGTASARLAQTIPGFPPLPDLAKVQQALALEPERTAQWYGAYISQRESQLKDIDRNNSLVHQQTGLMQDQASYERGVTRLRELGVPVPKDLPPTYDPALVAWYHKSSADRVSLLEQAKTEQLQAQAFRDQMAGLKDRAAIPGMVGDAARKAAALPGYTGNPERDAAIGEVLQRRGLPPTTTPDASILAEARQLVADSEVDVAGRKDAATEGSRVRVSQATGENAARLEKTEKPLEGEAALAVGQITTLLDMAKDATALWKADFTGPAVGRTGYLRQKAGQMDTQETAFRAVVDDISSILGQLRSGGAIPPDEMRRLEAVVPDYRMDGATFKAQVQRFERTLEQTRANRLRVGTTGRGQLREEMRTTTPRVGQPPGAPATGGRPVSEMSREELQAERDALRGRR